MPEETTPTLRETLESAIEAHSEPDAPAEAEPTEAAPEPQEAAPEPSKPDRARDETGRFKSNERTAPKAKAAATPTEPGPARAEGEADPSLRPALSAQPGVRAPQSWKPEMREKFASLPPDVQQEVLRVNRETAKVLQENAALRQGSQPWQEALKPYEAQIRAAGQEPVKYVGNLLQTAHALTYGSETQRAATLAEVIMSFGVSPQALDQALVSRLQGRQAPQQAQQPEFRDPRVDQIIAAQQQALQRQEQVKAAQADSTIDAFASSHEFFDQVANDMQAIMAGMAQSGKEDVTEQDLQWAYDAACLRNPEIAATLSARKATEAARAQAPAVQRAKLAAVSIKASPGAAIRDSGPRTLRQTIEDALASQR